METFSDILPYLVPPLLGALIGYVTNHIAIRMLFRPLRPWRLFGLRLPLTPGIIPSKRGELAMRMGEMVGDHLLTAADVGQTLEKETVQRELRRAVADKVERFLQRDLGPFETLLPVAYQQRFHEILELLQKKAQQQIGLYLASAEFETAFRRYFSAQGEALLGRNLAAVLPEARRPQLWCWIDEKFADFLQSAAVAREVGNYVDRLSDRLLSSRTPLADLLPQELVEITLQQLETELPALIDKFASLLYDPNFRKRMISRGKKAIDAFLDSLGGLSGLLSGFIDLEKIYAKLPEFLDHAGDEVSAWLREERTQQQAAQLIRQRLELLLKRSPAELLEKISFEKVSGVRGFVCKQVVARLQAEKTRKFLLELVETGADRIADRSFAGLIDQVLPAGGRQKLLNQLCDQILQRLRSEQMVQATGRLLQQQSEVWLCGKPLGSLAQRLPSDLQREIQSALYQLLNESLKKEAPRLIETLNVKQMVEEKVNRLDLLQVESLLMGVMKEQFKYINLFGGLLGFFIGLLNLLFLRLF